MAWISLGNVLSVVKAAFVKDVAAAVVGIAVESFVHAVVVGDFAGRERVDCL